MLMGQMVFWVATIVSFIVIFLNSLYPGKIEEPLATRMFITLIWMFVVSIGLMVISLNERFKK